MKHGVEGGLLPIETPRLLIRSLLPADVPSLVALWMDPEVTRHMGGPRDPAKVRDALESELKADAPDPFDLHPVIEKASGRIVGDCGLLRKEVDGRSEVEVVYVFAAEAWGRGYATEAASAVRDAAVHRLGIRRLIALIDPENTASARVAEKIEMRRERSTVRPGGGIRLIYAYEVPPSPSP